MVRESLMFGLLRQIPVEMRNGIKHLVESVLIRQIQFNKLLMEDTSSQVLHIHMVEVIMMYGLLRQINM